MRFETSEPLDQPREVNELPVDPLLSSRRAHAPRPVTDGELWEDLRPAPNTPWTPNSESAPSAPDLHPDLEEAMREVPRSSAPEAAAHIAVSSTTEIDDLLR